MQFAATVLYVDDVPRTVAFYRDTFAMEVRFWDRELGFAELTAAGTVLAIAAHSLGGFLMPGHYQRPASGGPCGVELGFFTDDVPAAYAKVLAAGATPVAAPRRMPWGLEVAYALAPDGTLIGLSEPPPSQGENNGV